MKYPVAQCYHAIPWFTAASCNDKQTALGQGKDESQISQSKLLKNLFYDKKSCCLFSKWVYIIHHLTMYIKELRSNLFQINPK